MEPRRKVHCGSHTTLHINLPRVFAVFLYTKCYNDNSTHKRFTYLIVMAYRSTAFIEVLFISPKIGTTSAAHYNTVKLPLYGHDIFATLTHTIPWLCLASDLT